MHLRYIHGALRFVEEVVPALFLALMVLIICTDVIGRYLFSAPIQGAAELATSLFLWVIFLGTAGAMQRHLHVNIDLLLTRLPPRWQAITYIAANVLLGVGMLIIVPFAWDYAVNNRRLVVLLNLEYRYIYIVIPASFLLVAVHTFANALSALVGMRTGRFELPRADQDYGVSEDTRPLFEPDSNELGTVAGQKSA